MLKTVLTLAFVFLGLANDETQALASLTPDDDAALTACLEDLSRGWVQPSVDQANTILSRPGYSAADWKTWFEGYFNTTGHPFTDDLHNYLYYPVFGWFDDTTHLKLQMGLIDPVWNKATGKSRAPGTGPVHPARHPPERIQRASIVAILRA